MNPQLVHCLLEPYERNGKQRDHECTSFNILIIRLHLHVPPNRPKKKKMQKRGHFVDDKQPLQVHDSSTNQITLIRIIPFFKQDYQAIIL